MQLLSLGLIGELIANSRARSGPDPAQIVVVVGPSAVAASDEERDGHDGEDATARGAAGAALQP